MPNLPTVTNRIISFFLSILSSFNYVIFVIIFQLMDKVLLLDLKDRKVTNLSDVVPTPDSITSH